MNTALYPTFEKRVNDAVEELILQQVTPWLFLTTGGPFQIKRLDGRQIAYEGIEFAGSPSTVFWSRYIEPFLEDIIISEIAVAVSMAKERGVDGRRVLEELQRLLSNECRTVYASMSDVDRRLSGNGRGTVNQSSVDEKIRMIDLFLDAHIQGELKMWKSKSQAEIWFQNNQFWVWIVGIIMGIAGVLLATR